MNCRILARRLRSLPGLLSAFLLLLCGSARAATVNGSVALDGWRGPLSDGSLAGVQITLQFASPSGVYFERAVTLGAGGAYTVANVPALAYSVGARGPSHLRSVVAANATGGTATANFNAASGKTLRPGDVDHNGGVNFDDFVLLSNSYELTSSDPGYNPSADLDGNNEVNFDDFVLLSNNYETADDPLPVVLRDFPQPGWAEAVRPLDSPAMVGAGPSSATSIDAATGVLENRPGPDLDAYNAVGPSPAFARRYRSALARNLYAAPGLTSGWTHNYDFRVAALPAAPGTWGAMRLVYPGGATEDWSPILNNGFPTSGVLTPPTPGTPYTISGQPSGVANRWNWLRVRYKDLSADVYEPTTENPDFYRLTQKVNAAGNSIFLRYHADGRLNFIESHTGQPLLSFAYAGSLISLLTDNVGGRSVRYEYGSGGLLEKVRQINTPGASRWEYQYQLVSGVWPLLTQVGVPDPTRQTANVTFYPATKADEGGAVREFTDAKGNTRAYVRDVDFTYIAARRPGMTTPDLAWRQYHTDGADAGVMDDDGKRVLVEYGDPLNPKKPTRVTNRNDQVTRIEYDTFGNVTKVFTPFRGADGSGGQEMVTEYEYEYPAVAPSGRLLRMRQGNATVGPYRAWTTFTYYDGGESIGGDIQPAGWLKRVDGPAPGTSSGAGGSLVAEYVYTTLGNVRRVTLPAPDTSGTVRVELAYNINPQTGAVEPARPERLGQPTRVQVQRSPTAFYSTFYDYDFKGNVTYARDGASYVTEYAYTFANQIERLIFPAATSGVTNDRAYMFFDYTLLSGALEKVTLYNPKGPPHDPSSGTAFQSVRYHYGREGEFDRAGEDALGSERTYDALYRAYGFKDGRLLSQANSLVFDNVGDLTRFNFPGNTGGARDSIGATYDFDGNPLTTRDGANRITTYVRHPDDSSISFIDYPVGIGARPDSTLGYDALGRVNRVEDAVASEVYSFDDLDNVTRVDTVYKDIPGQPTFGVTYNYFPDGSRASMGISRGSSNLGTYSYTYSEAGQLTETATPWGAIIKNGYRSVNGRLLEQSTPLTKTTYNTFHGRGFLTQVLNDALNPNGTVLTTLSNFSSLTYDAGGNRKQVPVSYQTVNTATGFNGLLNYGYDRYGRLTSEVNSQTGFYTPGYPLFYNWDSADNLLSNNTNTYTYNANSQINGFNYDDNGNPTGYGFFDQLNQLREAIAEGATVFTADYLADGRRAWKQSGGARFYYLYDGDTVICEINGSGGVSNAFGYGAAGLALRKPDLGGTGSYHAYLFDPSGNVVQRRTSGAGAQAADFSAFYDGFGVQRAQASAQFAGQFPTPDMVGYRGQWGWWTDNETAPIQPGGARVVRRPAVWTGSDYYDPSTLRPLTRALDLDARHAAEVANPYGSAPNPLRGPGSVRLTDYAPPGLFVDLGARRQAESLFDQAAGFGDSWGRWETGRGSGWEVAVRGGLFAADVLSIALPAANAVGVAVRASAGITRTAVTAYEVGEYNALRLRAAGTGLEIHHLPQAHLAEQIIPGYARASGLAIALPRSVHRNLSAASRLRGDFSNITAQEARGLLGRQLRDLRNADVPKDALRVLGREMRARYPHLYRR